MATTPITTNDAARIAGERLGRPVSERQVQTALRREPTLRPRIAAGRRFWTAREVDQLCRLLAGGRVIA